MKKWTRTVERAAHMIAQDHDTDREIATACKISERTLARWKRDTEFVARVEQIVTEYADRALRHGLARRDRRLRELGDIHQKLQQIATERSQDPDLQKLLGEQRDFWFAEFPALVVARISACFLNMSLTQRWCVKCEVF